MCFEQTGFPQTSQNFVLVVFRFFFSIPLLSLESGAATFDFDSTVEVDADDSRPNHERLFRLPFSMASSFESFFAF